MKISIRFVATLAAVFIASSFTSVNGSSCDTPTAYVATGDGVVVVDTSLNAVITTIPFSDPYSVVLNSAGSLLYVRGDPLSIAVIDTGTNTAVGSITSSLGSILEGASPFDLALDSHTNTLYVTNSGAGFQGGFTITVFNAATGATVTTIPSLFAASLALNPAGTRLYVGSRWGAVYVIETATFSTVATIPVAGFPGQLLVNPTGTRLYEARGDNVHVIDTVTNALVTTIPIGNFFGGGLALSPAADRLYLGNGSVVDTATNTVIAPAIPELSGSSGIALNATGTRLYVAVTDSSTATGHLLTVDTATHAVISTLPTGGNHASGIALSPCRPYSAQSKPPINDDGSSAFAANRGVIPVKFTLTNNGEPTCTLPAATIAVTRTAGTTTGNVNEAVYAMAADSGSNFRNDGCQYVYNLNAAALGPGTYSVMINIDGQTVGTATFKLK